MSSFFPMADSMLTTSLIFSVAFFVAALVSAFVGLAIRVYMGEWVRVAHARDMIGRVTGLVVTLVALVLGLLIWTAFGVFRRRRPSYRGSPPMRSSSIKRPGNMGQKRRMLGP